MLLLLLLLLCCHTPNCKMVRRPGEKGNGKNKFMPILILPEGKDVRIQRQ